MYYFQEFLVNATIRDNACDENSPIYQLQLDQKYGAYDVHLIETLKPIADRGQLWTLPRLGYPKAKVRIYQAWNGRWIATTSADNRQCNNLLSLPITYGFRTEGTVLYFQSCELR
ncbi:MAG TPA: hypothetical protein VNJ08_08755 [Bacteriovoracaceae bacterium]|nr:hypothetical protein [Bacteriovoracaceae bacterium]